MAYQDYNLLTKTIVSASPDDQDKKVAEFQKDHKVKFSQTHVVVSPEGKFFYVIVMFYQAEEKNGKKIQ